MWNSRKWIGSFRNVITAAAIGFWKDDCYSKSSVLTLYTLQSIVPLLAFLLGISHGFGFENYLRELILNTFEEQKEVVQYALQISDTMLKHLRGGVIAGMGFLYLFWTVVTLLGYIEYVLNDIWKVESPRTWIRKFTDYLAITIVCPLIFVISSSLTVYIKSEIGHLKEYPYLKEVSVSILYLFKIFPFVLSWLLFFLLYILIPNTKLRVYPRLLAAIIAGSIFQIWQLLYINAQIYIFSYNIVYGTVAVLPLFLIWLQVSWLITLAGAEFSAHMENDYFFDKRLIVSGEVEKINNCQLGLLILYSCLRSFYEGTAPKNDSQIAMELKLPLDATKKMLEVLVQGDIIGTVDTAEGRGYRPVRDPSLFNVLHICRIIQRSGDVNIMTEITLPLKHIDRILTQLDQAADNSPSNLNLKDFSKIA